MNTLDLLTVTAVFCFVLSFLIRKNGIRVAMISGVCIAGGWALDDITNGLNVNWAVIKEIIVCAILAGVAWELGVWLVRMVDNSAAGNN